MLELLYDAAFRAFNELDKKIHFFAAGDLIAHFFDSLRCIEFRREEQMISMMKLFDSFLRVAAAAQADLIKAVTFCVISLNYREWRSVLDYNGVTSHEGFEANSAELMDARVGSDIRPVGDLDVAGKRGRVSQ